MPKDASEVRILLGMTNFCCRFIRNYAIVTEPLRKLTKRGEPFVWTGKQERALEKLCDALTKTSENAYFDSTKTTEDDPTLQAVMKAIRTGKSHDNSKNARIDISDFSYTSIFKYTN